MEEIAPGFERSYSCYSLCEVGDGEREGFLRHILLPVDDSQVCRSIFAYAFAGSAMPTRQLAAASQDSQEAVAWAARNVWRDGAWGENFAHAGTDAAPPAGACTRAQRNHPIRWQSSTAARRGWPAAHSLSRLQAPCFT